MDDQGYDSPSNLLNGFADIVRDFLVHCTVLLGVCEALATEFLLSGVEALVHVVAVIASGIACWSGVHDEDFVGRVTTMVAIRGSVRVRRGCSGTVDVTTATERISKILLTDPVTSGRGTAYLLELRTARLTLNVLDTG